MPPGHQYGNVSASDSVRQHVGDNYSTTNNYYPPESKDQPDPYHVRVLNEQLLDAAKDGQVIRLKHLLTKPGASIDYEADRGLTAIHCAAWGGHQDCVELLLTHGAYVNAKCAAYGTPLCLAAIRGHYDLVRYLLHEHKANPNEVGGRLGSALHAACLARRQDGPSSTSRAETARALLACGADVRSKAYIGRHSMEQIQSFRPRDKESEHAAECEPLHLAAFYGSADVVRLLLEHGADPNCQVQGYLTEGPSGATPLMLACTDDSHAAIVDTLLAKGDDPEQTDGLGQNASFFAARHNSPNCLRRLLKWCPFPNIRCSQGRTPLMLAAEKGHYDCTEVLLKFGADMSIHDNEGYDAKAIAAENGFFASAGQLHLAYKWAEEERRRECEATDPDPLGDWTII